MLDVYRSASIVITREEVVNIVNGGIDRRHPPQFPFALASGATSWEYADIKYAIAHGRDLGAVGRYAVDTLRLAGIEFNTVGGLTMGAAPLSAAVALIKPEPCGHFEVCKAPETKYSEEPQWIVGRRFTPGDRILVTEDTTSTGGSANTAIDRIQTYIDEHQIDDVEIVGVCTVLNRGEAAAERFAARGIGFVALTTYEDFGLAPVA